MNEKTKNMLIGIFVIAACVILVSFILFLKPRVGDGKQTLVVRFSNIDKINVGTQVMYAGKAVGEVVSISEIPNAREQPTDILGRVYVYQLVLKIDSHVVVYNCDEIAIQSSGLLGEKSIGIIPKAPPKGVIPKVIGSDPIYADSVDPLENALLEVSELANTMEETFKNVTKWIDQNGDTMASAIQSVEDVMDEVKLTVAQINQNNLVDDISTAIQNFSCTMQLASEALAQMHDQAVFTNLSVVMDNAKTASASIDTITQDIADGRGTLGKLVKDDDLYLRFTAIMSKADTMMNDINHYGILFHLNKQWQRSRTQRLDLLNALDTPCGFRTYFQNEVDQINTAMARLSILIARAQCSGDRVNEDLFRKDFAELLRLSKELSDNLRLYNEQLTDAHDQCQGRP